jgi:hypothetical protein
MKQFIFGLFVISLVACAGKPSPEQAPENGRTPAGSPIIQQFQYRGEPIGIMGQVERMTDPEGIIIRKVAVVYRNGRYYMGDDNYPYRDKTQDKVCAAFGYRRSRPQMTGAWIHQKGIYLADDRIITESLNNKSYVLDLMCANVKIGD